MNWILQLRDPLFNRVDSLMIFYEFTYYTGKLAGQNIDFPTDISNFVFDEFSFVNIFSKLFSQITHFETHFIQPALQTAYLPDRFLHLVQNSGYFCKFRVVFPSHIFICLSLPNKIQPRPRGQNCML